MKTIKTIGDSHSMFAWDKVNIPGVEVVVYHLGPRTLYTASQGRIDFVHEILHNKAGKPRIILPDDLVVASFGEIDVRAHFHKHVKNEGDIVVLVENYLNQLQDQLQGKCRVGVYSIVPPRKVDGVDTSSFSIPFLGTDKQRKQWTRELNHYLRLGCELRGFVFVDVSSSQEDADGFLNWEKSDKVCHVVDPEPIQRFFNQLWHS